MQESFRKYYLSNIKSNIRKDALSEEQVHQLCDQILGNLDGDDPAWVTHVQQALANKGVSPADTKRILLELRDKMIDSAQSDGEE
jgi:translation elongation factor EF-G